MKNIPALLLLLLIIKRDAQKHNTLDSPQINLLQNEDVYDLVVYGGTSSGVIASAIDPYQIQGDPSSGFLPRIHADWGGKIGDGDRGVQAYNY